MIWMLDTNTCSYILRRRPPAVKERFDAVGHANIGISALVLAELLFGAERHPTRREPIRQDIEDFKNRLQVFAWSPDAAQHYSVLRAQLQSRGTPIGSMDMLIAAHALAMDATLVTNNLREFKRVPGLKLEDWVR